MPIEILLTRYFIPQQLQI